MHALTLVLDSLLEDHVQYRSTSLTIAHNENSYRTRRCGLTVGTIKVAYSVKLWVLQIWTTLEHPNTSLANNGKIHKKRTEKKIKEDQREKGKEKKRKEKKPSILLSVESQSAQQPCQQPSTTHSINK
jgi:hypothetical protein